MSQCLVEAIIILLAKQRQIISITTMRSNELSVNRSLKLTKTQVWFDTFPTNSSKVRTVAVKLRLSILIRLWHRKRFLPSFWKRWNASPRFGASKKLNMLLSRCLHIFQMRRSKQHEMPQKLLALIRFALSMSQPQHPWPATFTSLMTIRTS